jgi:hypothetical protein
MTALDILNCGKTDCKHYGSMGYPHGQPKYVREQFIPPPVCTQCIYGAIRADITNNYVKGDK